MFGLNRKLSYLIFLVVVVVGVFSYSVESMRFDLPSGKHRCMAENMNKNSLTVGNYSIVNPNVGQPLPANHNITVQVTTTGGTVTHHFAEGVQAGQFSFVATQSGDHIICFWVSSDDSIPTLSIDFEWRTGVASKSWSNIAKKSKIDRMGFEVEILTHTAALIQEEMISLRRLNEESLETNWITDTRMCHFIFLSFFITFSVAGLQLWHLKRFFEKRKFI